MLDPPLNMYLHYLQFTYFTWLGNMHAVVYKKKTVHTFTLIRGSSLCNKRHKWPLTLHLCPMSTYLTDILLPQVSSIWQHTHTWRKNYLSSCRQAACWCVVVIHCQQQSSKVRSWLCLKANPIPQQPEAKLKVFLAIMIKQAETSCRTIYNPLNTSGPDAGQKVNDYQCPTHTFCSFKAVRPVGWGTRLKLRCWLLRFLSWVVIRWLSCAGWEVLKVVTAQSVSQAAWLTGLISISQKTDWLKPRHIVCYIFVFPVTSTCCFQPNEHLLSPAPQQLLSNHSKGSQADCKGV